MLGLANNSIFEEKEHLKWSTLRDKPAETMYQTMQGEVFPFIKNLHADQTAPIPNTWMTPFSRKGVTVRNGDNFNWNSESFCPLQLCM